MIKVSIIDTDHNSRNLVKTVLQGPGFEHEDVSVVYESDSYDSYTDFKPSIKSDVLLLEPNGQPSGIIRKIREQHPKLLIIVLSKVYGYKQIRDYLYSGAVSYLCKKNFKSYLHFTVATTYKGGSFITPEVCRKLVINVQKVEDRKQLLTARELQIANGLATGMSYKMIAHHYNISINTVRVYIKRIYNKFDINSKGELISEFSA